jgi:Zn-dependent peptidase ImmA (M78 family)
MAGALSEFEANTRICLRLVSINTLLSERELRERVIELVQSVRSQLLSNVSNDDIERCFGLEICENTLPMDKDGAYIESESKIVININITSVERRQFTLFHELVHNLIRRDDELYSYLHDTYEDTNDFDRTIELVCNVGAAEFILPRDRVRALIDNQGFSIDLVPQLCQQELVSGPAALIQLIQNAPNRCYGVICDYGSPQYYANGNQKAFIQPQQISTLYIQYAMWAPSAKYSLARFTQIPKDHLLMQVLMEDRMIKGIERIPFRSGTEWKVPAEAISYRGKVYGLFNVTPPPNPQQLRFL